MPSLAFDALDYRSDQSFAQARYRYEGDEASGWIVERDGIEVLRLGAGFRLLRTLQCGVCSTDLARHFLPFPLPQVIGHEVVAVDERGSRYVVEINASHAARGVADECPFCSGGLPTHCPARVTLGIHDLPGGFGPWILVPTGACLRVPDSVPDSAAVLVEPFAAALHAVHTLAPRPGERIAVLGPRRLGMLVVAALAGVRTKAVQRGEGFDVVAVVRDPALAPLARSFGATDAVVLGRDAIADASFDVVVDTTGNPEGLELAVRLARREVHLKSTHGREAAGVAHLTELVVDELAIDRFPLREPVPSAAAWDRLCTGERPRVAWLAESAPPPAWLAARAHVIAGSAAEVFAAVRRAPRGLPRADVAVVDSARGVAEAIRPIAGLEESLVRPRGDVLVLPNARTDGSPLLDAIAHRGLRLSSSRCGEFAPALQLLADDPELARIGERLVTHRFRAGDLAAAFDVARSRACIKAVVEHDVGSPA